MKHFKKKTYLLAGMILLSMILAGCNKDEDTGETIPEFKSENAIVINNDLSITATLVESFAESYYQRDELLKMVSDEATSYNNAFGAGSLRAEKVETSQDLVNVVMLFSGREAYADYNETVFFVGTIEDALNIGLKMDQVLYDINDPAKTIDNDSLSSMKDTYILITNAHETKAPLTIETFGRISYVSEGIEKWHGRTSARIAGPTGGLVYIIFK